MTGGPITATGTISGTGPCYVAGSGTAQAQTAIYSPAITLTAGQQACWLPTAANTAAGPTFAPNGLTAHAIVKAGGISLVANDLLTTAVACAVYDTTGTQWELQNPQATTGTGNAVLSTSPTLVTPILGIITSGDATNLANIPVANALSGSILGPANGGTGVNNGTKIITIGGNFTTTGAFNPTLTFVAGNTYTFPNGSATLATLGANTYSADQTFGNNFLQGVNTLHLNSGTQIKAPSDGLVELVNNAGTSFVRAQFGGTTSSFPAVKLFGNALAYRQADDTIATFSTLTACGSTGEGAVVAVSDSTTITWGATITGSGANHVLAYCDGTNWTVAAK